MALGTPQLILSQSDYSFEEFSLEAKARMPAKVPMIPIKHAGQPCRFHLYVLENNALLPVSYLLVPVKADQPDKIA